MLVCYANKDSLVIFNTRGIFYPLIIYWIGKEERLTGRGPGWIQHRFMRMLRITGSR